MSGGVLDVYSGAVSSQSSVMVDQLVRSSEFGRVLQAVEDRARHAVVDETKKNAMTLMTFAVAGGAIGGMVFKGFFGTVAAAGLAAWAGMQLMGGSEATPPNQGSSPKSGVK